MDCHKLQDVFSYQLHGRLWGTRSNKHLYLILYLLQNVLLFWASLRLADFYVSQYMHQKIFLDIPYAVTRSPRGLSDIVFLS
jgi:hypothetical protein